MLNFEKPIYKITEYIENKNYGKSKIRCHEYSKSLQFPLNHISINL